MSVTFIRWTGARTNTNLPSAWRFLAWNYRCVFGDVNDTSVTAMSRIVVEIARFTSLHRLCVGSADKCSSRYYRSLFLIAISYLRTIVRKGLRFDFIKSHAWFIFRASQSTSKIGQHGFSPSIIEHVSKLWIPSNQFVVSAVAFCPSKICNYSVFASVIKVNPHWRPSLCSYRMLGAVAW